MEKAPETLLKTLKNTSPEIEKIFTQGGCYQLYLILSASFKQTECWYDVINGHVYTKIGRFFYDINGKYTKKQLPDQTIPMHTYGKRVKPSRWKYSNSKNEQM